MRSRTLIVDESLRVLPDYDSQDYPLSIHEQPVGKPGYGNIPHWHSEAQFSLVIRGSVQFQTSKGEFLLQKGEGIFFNSNYMHEAIPGGPGDNAYLCIKFMPRIVYGQVDSRIYTKYVEPILYSPHLQVVPLRKEEWERSLCAKLERLVQIYEEADIGYEMRINALLLQCWLLLYKNEKPQENQNGATISLSDKNRIEMLHAFIHQNYTEKITLEEIANAAHISRGECCRVFKRLHHMTPFQYVIHYRLSQSIRLLAETDYSISEIAQQVGFGSSSYYTECFKRELHCPPHKYRQKLNSLNALKDPEYLG